MKWIIKLFNITSFVLLWIHAQARQSADVLSWCHYSSPQCKPSEFNCACENYDGWVKELSAECISQTWVCDAWTDCSNGADELDCMCPPGIHQCNDCKDDEASCVPLYQCVPSDDAGNVSNIVSIVSPIHDCANDGHKYGYEERFKCNNGLYISSSLWCNEDDDCKDGSDEQGCGYYKYRCTSNQMQSSICKWGECYKETDRCNGRVDCIDNSDEWNCSSCPSQRPLNCACNQAENYFCEGSYGFVCFNEIERCDGKPRCSDHSDEWNCAINCPLDKPLRCACNQFNNYTCNGIGHICYDESDACNTYGSCTDSTDELNCTCPDQSFTCACFRKKGPTCSRKKGCIRKELVNDGKFDCDGGDDEGVIAIQRVQCGSCIVSIMRFENETFCRSPWCDSSTCYDVPSTKCSIYECDDTEVICISSCIEHNATNDCNKVMQCSDKDAILNSNFCNGRYDCDDGSDEITNQPGFKCSPKASPITCVLPQWNLYDNVAHCYDRSDICFGEDGSFLCYQCLDKRLIISSQQVCDDVIDCYDLSDECLCETTTLPICLDVFMHIDPSKLECSRSSTTCGYGNSTSMHDVTCNGVAECANAIDEINCSNNVFTIKCESKWGDTQAVQCDGRPECKYFEDECGSLCNNHPIFCADPCHSFYPLGDRYCDGYIDEAWKYLNNTDCLAGFDEKNCPMRFSCAAGKKVSIDVLQTCNGVEDCDDGSDEKDCPDRFYCDSKFDDLESISMDRYLDGVQDCFDGSDEFRFGIFSSPHEMITNGVLLVWFWIIAVITLLGNMYAICMSFMKLANKKLTNMERCNYLLVLNLSMSDILMGIYLLIVIIKARIYSGNYSMHDREWRTSIVCSLAGSLCVLSSQTSCFMMTIFTAHRLFTILKPFKARTASTTPWKLAITLAWLTSILLVILSNVLDYFKHGVLHQTRFSVSDTVSHNYVITFACRLAGLTNTPMEAVGGAWENVDNFLSKSFPQYAPQGNIGYYGTTSMCIPKYYATSNNRYWTYSMCIITLNLISFSFVVAVYVFIWKQMSNRPICSDQALKDAKTLQKRITRLIATDFLCWIPICIIAYLNIAGVTMPDEIDMFTAGVLLPINSALNPLLYSKHIEDLFSKLVKRLRCKNKLFRKTFDFPIKVFI